MGTGLSRRTACRTSRAVHPHAGVAWPFAADPARLGGEGAIVLDALVALAGVTLEKNPPVLVRWGDRAAVLFVAEAQDLEAMKKRGLTVIPVSEAQRAEWQKVTETLYPEIKGWVVPGEAFDEAMRLRDEYRKQQ